MKCGVCGVGDSGWKIKKLVGYLHCNCYVGNFAHTTLHSWTYRGLDKMNDIFECISLKSNFVIEMSFFFFFFWN